VQTVNGATWHEKLGQHGRAGHGMVVLVHVAPQKLVATTWPVPSVVQVPIRVCWPDWPQVPWQTPTVWKEHE